MNGTATGRRGGPTIARWMLAIAGAAVLLMMAIDRRWALLGFAALPAALAIACGSVVLHYATSPSLGRGCPYCGRVGLERRAVASFGRRYYLCRGCGVRCMRAALGAWEDASGPEHDARYARPAADDPWTGPPALDDGDLVASKTHQSLIRSKRARSPRNPNGPGLE